MAGRKSMNFAHLLPAALGCRQLLGRVMRGAPGRSGAAQPPGTWGAARGPAPSSPCRQGARAGGSKCNVAAVRQRRGIGAAGSTGTASWALPAAWWLQLQPHPPLPASAPSPHQRHKALQPAKRRGVGAGQRLAGRHLGAAPLHQHPAADLRAGVAGVLPGSRRPWARHRPRPPKHCLPGRGRRARAGPRSAARTAPAAGEAGRRAGT